MQANLLELLASSVDQLKLSIDEETCLSLLQYVDLLISWNTKINLVSYKSFSDLIILHIVDCLIVLKAFSPSLPQAVIDIGSGAGLPGLVLKIASESSNVTLVEKNAKRALFLKETIRIMGLKNIVVLNRDYKQLRIRPYYKGYEIVVSRAFSSRPDFFKDLTCFLKDSGSLLIMAGPSFEENRLNLTDFSPKVCWEGTLPYSNQSRKLLSYSKTVALQD